MGINQELEEKTNINSVWMLRKTLADYRHWLQTHASVLNLDVLNTELYSSDCFDLRDINSNNVDASIEKAHLALKQKLGVLQLDIKQCAFTLSHQKLPPITQLDKQQRRIQTQLKHAAKQLTELKIHEAALEKRVLLIMEAFNPDTIALHIEHCRQQLQSSWTTHGMSRAMESFFVTFANNLVEMQRQANLCNDQLIDIFAKHSEDGVNELVFKSQLNLAPHIQALSLLQRQTGNFKRHYRTMLTHKNAVIQLFSDTLVKEAQFLFQQVFHDIIHWPVQALTPLTQYWSRQKKQLTKQLIQVTHLVHQLEEEQQELLNLRVELRATHEAIAALESIRREFTAAECAELNRRSSAEILSSSAAFTADAFTTESYLAP